MVQVGNDPVRGGFHMFRRVAHGDAEAGRAQHLNIVVRVAHGNAFRHRNAEETAQALQSGTLIHASGVVISPAFDQLAPAQ